MWGLCRKVLEQINSCVELWLTSGFTSLLSLRLSVMHLLHRLFRLLAPPTPNAAKLMERKTSKHGRNDAKVCGCAGVINGDESVVRVDVDVKVLHCVPAPFSPTHTSKRTRMHKQKHYVIMTSLEKGGGSECTWGLTLFRWHVETFTLYPNE